MTKKELEKRVLKWAIKCCGPKNGQSLKYDYPKLKNAVLRLIAFNEGKSVKLKKNKRKPLLVPDIGTWDKSDLATWG